MLVLLTVTVVFLDDGIEKLGEFGVRIVRSSVETNTRIKVLDTREDAGLESDTGCVTLILILLPNFLGKMLRKKRLSSSGEESSKIFKISSVFNTNTCTS